MTTANRGTVLLIEDEEAIADLLRLYCEQEGFRLIHASTGERGLEAVRERDPRAVLLDVGLPGMDGIEVCRRIRAVSDVPVIISARADEVGRSSGLEVSADDYVQAVLAASDGRVRRCPRRAEEARVPSIISGRGWRSIREAAVLASRCVVRPCHGIDRPGISSRTAACCRVPDPRGGVGFDYHGETAP
jgi:CheY-like chemotaxis protein